MLQITVSAKKNTKCAQYKPINVTPTFNTIGKILTET